MSRYGMDGSKVWVLRSVLQQTRTKASVSSPPIEEPGRWVDVLSEQEAKQLLLVRYLNTIVDCYPRFKRLTFTGDWPLLASRKSPTR